MTAHLQMPTFEYGGSSPWAALGQALGGLGGMGLGTGIQQLMQQQEKQKTQRDLESILGKEGAMAISRLPPQAQGQAFKALLQEQQISQLLGGGVQPRPTGEIPETMPREGETERELSPQQRLAINVMNPALGQAIDRQEKMKQQERLAFRKEGIPIRQEYAKKAAEGRKAVENLEEMARLVEKGDLTHPFMIGISKYLPEAMGNFLLSTSSHEYRSRLFDNFGILKVMFPGQIRVAELQLLEDKLAGLEKNDAAKRAILKTQMKASKRDVILGEAAAKVDKESPWLSPIEFEERVHEIATPQLQKLADEIMNDYNEIAEKYGKKKDVLKKVDPGTPLTEEAAKKIMKKAKTVDEAMKMAKQLGYDVDER